MRGFPTHLNTKRDYLNMLAVLPEETKEELRQVLKARFTWQPVKKLKATENPKETESKKVIELPVNGLSPETEPKTERWLYELKEDPHAWLFRLGFTVEEAEQLIS